jgi:hypothetical protein
MVGACYPTSENPDAGHPLSSLDQRMAQCHLLTLNPASALTTNTYVERRKAFCVVSFLRVPLIPWVTDQSFPQVQFED